MTRPFLYQTIGYASDNQNPTEEHINQALVKAFQMPAASRNHTRVWLPHREPGDVLSDIWNWMDVHTHASTVRNLITNCGHVAIWTMIPELDSESEDNGWGIDYPDAYFEGGFLSGSKNFLNNPSVMNDFVRNYGMGIAISAMEYARTLQDFGYDVGFLSAPFMAPNAWNTSFGSYYDRQPVVPILMIYAGTKGNVIRHSYHRNKITTDTMANKSMIKIDISESGKPSDWGYKNLNYWEDSNRSNLVGYTQSEVESMNFTKYSENFVGLEVTPTPESDTFDWNK